MAGGANMVTGMSGLQPGMQLVAEPVATGQQIPMGISMESMTMPGPTAISMPSPVPSMNMPIATTGTSTQGAVIQNMPIYGGTAATTQMPMTTTTAPPVYVDQMATAPAPAVYTG